MLKKLKELDEGISFCHFVTRELFELDLDGDYFRVYTYGDNLAFPIFHVIDMNIKKDIGVCMFEPRFYQYTRDTYTYNNFLVDEFDKALRQPNTTFSHLGLTNWETIVHFWNNDHRDKLIDLKKISQPDYTKLEENPIKRRSLIQTIIAKWNA